MCRCLALTTLFKEKVTLFLALLPKKRWKKIMLHQDHRDWGNFFPPCCWFFSWADDPCMNPDGLFDMALGVSIMTRLNWMIPDGLKEFNSVIFHLCMHCLYTGWWLRVWSISFFPSTPWNLLLSFEWKISVVLHLYSIITYIQWLNVKEKYLWCA